MGVRFEVFMALRMMMFFWAPCRLIGRCKHFRETYCLHLQGSSGDFPTPSAFPPANPTENCPLPSIATSALKMEIICFSETMASTDKSTQHQKPKTTSSIT
jgi:hypothetical protein